MIQRNPAVPLVEAARTRGEIRRVWEAPGEPALLLAELQDVVFWIAPGIDGVIFLDGEAVVEESLRFFKPVNAPGRALGRTVRAPRVDEIRCELDAVLLPVDPGWMNYYHWLLIHAPTLRAAGTWLPQEIPADLPRHADHVGIPRSVAFAASVMEESLLGVTRPMLPLAPGAYRARRLFRFHLDSPQPAVSLRCEPWWQALLGLERTLRETDQELASGAERIFVSRRGARRRTLGGEDDPGFQHALTEAGFVTLELAGRGLAEQARLFRAARWIVGPHGSGLSNLLFCAPGASVLEINAPIGAETETRPHTRRLAARRGLRYEELLLDASVPEGAQLTHGLRRWLAATGR